MSHVWAFTSEKVSIQQFLLEDCLTTDTMQVHLPNLFSPREKWRYFRHLITISIACLSNFESSDYHTVSASFLF